MANSTELQLVISAKDEASSKLRQVSGNMSKFSGVAKDVARHLGTLSLAAGAAAIAMGVKAVKAANQYENALLGLSSVAKAFNVDQERAKQAAESLAEDGLMTIADAATGLKNLLASRFNLDEAIRLMNAFKDSAAFGRQGALDFGQAINGATEGIKNGNSILVDNAGITKNLSVILEEAGFSAQDLMKATTDASVRQAIYNGVLKEAAIFQGDAGRLAGTSSGAISKLSTSVTKLQAEIGKQLNPQVVEAVKYLDNLTNTVRTNPKYMEAFGRVLSAIGKTIQAVISAVKSFSKALETLFYYMFVGIDKAQKVWSLYTTAVKNNINTIIGYWDKLRDALNKPISGTVNIFQKIKDKLSGKALGGPVTSGIPYIVGENRPEVFVPSQSGNIRQLDQVGGREVTVNFNNVSVRSDYDLNYIVKVVKDTLARDQKMASFGIRTM